MLANRRVSRREIAFRQELWRAGARGYRLRSKLPGHPDIVFPRLKLAVFVHGCFWHGCQSCALPRPRANADFWADKLNGNMARDADTSHKLRKVGWDVVTVWEHEIRPDPVPRARQLAVEIISRRRALVEGLG